MSVIVCGSNAADVNVVDQQLGRFVGRVTVEIEYAKEDIRQRRFP